MPRRAPSFFAQDRAEVATFDKPCRRASLYLAPMTPRAITGKIARLITTAWPASPKKDADARNKRGHRGGAEFPLSRISRPRELDPWPRSSSRPTSSGTWHCPKPKPPAIPYATFSKPFLPTIRKRARLTVAVGESSTVYVFQALSGG